MEILGIILLIFVSYVIWDVFDTKKHNDSLAAKEHSTTKGTAPVGSQFTPEQIGALLSASLIYPGYDPTQVAEKELSIVRAAGVPRDAYVHECFVLKACAIAFPVERLIGNQFKEQVLAGFVKSLSETASRFPALRSCERTFQRRFPVYRQAAMADAAGGPDDGVMRIHLSGAFGDTLLTHTTQSPESEGMCQMLAMAVAYAIWMPQVQGGITTLRSFGNGTA